MSSIAPSASASRLRKSVAGYSGLIVLSLIWGMAFVAIKQADSELSPVNLALIRWFIASACYLVLIPLIGRWKTRLQRRDIPRLLAIAFSNVAGYHISLYYAETTVSAGLAGILISFGPVFVVILSHFLLNEKAGRRILLGLLLAVVGTLVLSVSTVNFADFASLYGPAEVILSAAFYALFTVLSKPLVHRYGAPPITIWSGLIGTTMMLPLLSQSFVSQLEVLSAIGWASVLYLSVLSTVLGYLLFFTLVSRGAVSRLSIQLFLAPMVSVAGGALLLSEPVSAATVVGGGMMLVAVGLVTGIKRK